MAEAHRQYTKAKISKLYSTSNEGPEVTKLSRADGRKTWANHELPTIGENLGFLKRPVTPMVYTVFITKGGVLKTTLTLNIARVAALHNIKTCIVGLDMQADISTVLGSDFDDSVDFENALAEIEGVKGLPDLFNGQASLKSLIKPTDLPTLFYIPETPELVTMEQSLSLKNRREYWLKENVIAPLTKLFDLVLVDCSPSWNLLTTNALMATDVLVSPVECKVNNFRNLKVFQAFISEFQNDLHLSFEHLYVATKLANNRRLSREIFEWYRDHLPKFAPTAIRESTAGEEATALQLSLPEYSSGSKPAVEMNQVIQHLWSVSARRIRISEADSVAPPVN